ncbi:MAG: S9 family peptidase [Spirulinaceae cyanobacterium SM2_1_0]|nr:S9 family peptidase [Spirulinaceae cyanobacterium SM2_1_0]
MRRQWRWWLIGAIALCTTFLATPSRGDIPWQTPPAPIDQLLDAPLSPAVSIAPQRQWLLELEQPALRSLAELAEPTLGLAGHEINPRTHAPADLYTYRGLRVRQIPDGPWQSIQDLPAQPRISYVQWSPDGEAIAFTLERDTGLELWIANLATAQARRLMEPVLNATDGNPCDWQPDSQGLVCKIVPAANRQPPPEPEIPDGPRVEENLGRTAPARTYTNLLQNQQDVVLFEHYFTSALVEINLQGDRRPLVAPQLVDRLSLSPDGRYLLLETLHRPFSYQVPAWRFPKRSVILDSRTGEEVYEIADLPLADNIPIAIGSTRPGRRQIVWRSDQPATLCWVEALDGGDAEQAADYRDALWELPAPFTAQPQQLWRSQYRFSQVDWGREDAALVWEWWYNNRQERLWRLNPAEPTAAPQLLLERNYQDAYNDPGEPLLEPNRYGRSVLHFSPDGEAVYFAGRGASPEGVYPFLARRSLSTGETERLWQASDPYFEQVVDFGGTAAPTLLTRRQSPQEPPNYFYYDSLTDSTPQALTDYGDRAPQFAEVQKQIVTYERADGVSLSATLYLPPGYDAARDGPLPTLFWVYPEEFKDVETAGQVTTAANTFIRPYRASVLYLLLRGYAVVANPSLPIVGVGDREPNDTYIEQLVAGATAAVETFVDQGIADPQRLLVGGHSYGAFTTANLLAHTDLFSAGIARSGAYNRTLTPFGFQGEQRNFWQAQDAYIGMSPFTYADQINEPLLLIHGGEDANAGTYPMQSERLYEALKGLGGTVRWVELPFEGHGYEARESVAHVLWEVMQWSDRHTQPDSPN